MLTFADSDGKILGHDAVKFFQRSHLPQQILAKVGSCSAWVPGVYTADRLQFSVCLQVWTLADTNRQGYLDEKAFAKVSPAVCMSIAFLVNQTHRIALASDRLLRRLMPSPHES